MKEAKSQNSVLILSDKVLEKLEKCEVVGDVYRTTNYRIFSKITANRSINLLHLNRLKKAIQERDLLHARPIEVNENLEVIDGQHRLTAAKELKLPIYFIVLPDLKQTDIQILNSNNKLWTTEDYLNSYINQGLEEYKKVGEFCERTGITPAAAVFLLCGQSDTDGPNKRIQALSPFREGTYKVTTPEFAETIVKWIEDYSGFFPFARTRNFINTLINLARIEGYDHERMMSNLSQQPTRLTRCVSMTDYLKVLEPIYNYNQDRRKIVRFY